MANQMRRVYANTTAAKNTSGLNSNYPKFFIALNGLVVYREDDINFDTTDYDYEEGAGNYFLEPLQSDLLNQDDGIYTLTYYEPGYGSMIFRYAVSNILNV